MTDPLKDSYAEMLKKEEKKDPELYKGYYEVSISQHGRPKIISHRFCTKNQ